MSLAWRIMLLALLLNAVTVGSVQVAVYLAQQSWLDNRSQAVGEFVSGSLSQLERVYSPKAISDASADAAVVRKLLTETATHEIYEDIIVTSGRPPYEGIYFNPLGAVHRDPDAFPSALITSNLTQARSAEGMAAVAGGYCYALRRDDAPRGEGVVGYLWFRPRLPPSLPASLPAWTALVGVVASTLLFGVVLFWVTRATIRRPLQAIGVAAAAVGSGRYDVHLPEGQGVPELDPLVATFNHMASQVKGHTDTLEKAVRDAVEATKQKERALVLSSRLASIGTLAAGVAHEINTPIGGMQNAVNRLLQQKDLADKPRVYLQLVQDGLQRIARTARRLLDFSPRNMPPGNFALPVAIERAKALVEHRLASANVQVQIDVPRELPPVHGDAHEIQQVLLNLLLNSLDALEEKGAGRITVRATHANGQIQLLVEDDGPGMDPSLLPRVFDPFFTKKERPDASGLGMFICYSIVQNHGGEIRVDSRLGEGFRVHITLPAAVA
jgi:signal transduction histidine kinase